MAAPWAMATILSGPNGLYDLAEEALGPLRREINRDKGKRKSIAGVGCTVYPTHGPIVYAPKPNNERPDLGIEDAPNFRDLQRFSTEYSLMAMQVNTAKQVKKNSSSNLRRPSTAPQSRLPPHFAFTSGYNLHTAGDDRIRPSFIIPERRPSEAMMQHLRGATPIAADRIAAMGPAPSKLVRRSALLCDGFSNWQGPGMPPPGVLTKIYRADLGTSRPMSAAQVAQYS